MDTNKHELNEEKDEPQGDARKMWQSDEPVRKNYLRTSALICGSFYWPCLRVHSELVSPVGLAEADPFAVRENHE